MAIGIEFFLSRSFFSLLELHKSRIPMLFLALFLFIFFSFSVIFISLYKILKRKKRVQEEEEEKEKPIWNSLSIFRCSFPSTTHQTSNSRPLIPETICSNFPKLASLIASSFPNDSSIGQDGSVGNERTCNGSELDGLKDEDYVKGGEQNGKKKKKRGKKKKSSIISSFQCEDGGEEQNSESQLQGLLQMKHSSSDGFYPFTSSSSMTQRKIKSHYDQLVKSHDSKALTLAQVSQFVNCLVEARNELQHKSETIQRRFTITKALLFKADRSSFDRLSQQIYKLEAEHKRLEEDALVYNRLQQQLKLSPAYKQMLELGARMELKASSDQFLEEAADTEEFSSISFEELLAQEKKDTFWQRNGRLRSCTN